MGTNLFIEGHPAPIIITIKLQREVVSFKDISDVVLGLDAIRIVLRKEWEALWPGFPKYRQRRDVHLIKFHVYSPPEFTIVVDPAWLAVFITVLANYKNIKSNYNEIRSDLDICYKSIRGLTSRQIELLDIAVRLTLGHISDKSEKVTDRVSRRLHKIARRILGESEAQPEVDIVDVDKDKKW